MGKLYEVFVVEMFLGGFILVTQHSTRRCRGGEKTLLKKHILIEKLFVLEAREPKYLIGICSLSGKPGSKLLETIGEKKFL